MLKKIAIYTIVNIITVAILTAIPYNFISYINFEWQNFSEWTPEGRGFYGLFQAAIYFIGLMLTNLTLSQYLHDK